MNKTIVAPSLLACDLNNLLYDIQCVEEAGADWLHFDIMDGHFVPNIALGLPIVKCVGHNHNLVNDVHLMITDPFKYAREYIKAGADILTFHYEACKNDKEVFAMIDLIHDYGAKAGISVKPDTPIDKIFPFLYSLDLVLIMTVEPGFGGQEFMTDMLSKIVRLKDYFNQNEITKVLIEVDGGLNKETAKLAKVAGADVIVAGTYIFGHDDMADRIASLK